MSAACAVCERQRERVDRQLQRYAEGQLRNYPTDSYYVPWHDCEAAVTREDNIVQAIRRWLSTLPDCEHRKLHGTEYSVKGDPDLYGCLRGRMFVIEVKQPGEEPSVLQHKRLRDWAQAGALTGWTDSLDGAKEILRPIL